MKITINNKIVNKDSLQVEGVSKYDHPKYCDAFFSYGEYVSGLPIDDRELDELTDKYPELVNEIAHESRFL